ncbi:MAG: hypothetical protein RI980_1678 [Bacteroidota bacterium]|jgi:preprotein translocase subunit SecG|nr:MAG: preprotein translocase subunit SecG [Flavobacteriia bacterium]
MSFTIFLALIIIVCFLLILTIMVQNPKSGGLSSSFGGGGQMGGVKNTTDFLEKTTWVLGGSLIVLILFSTLSFNSGSTGSKLVDENAAPAIVKDAPAKSATTPATKPADSAK